MGRMSELHIEKGIIEDIDERECHEEHYKFDCVAKAAEICAGSPFMYSFFISKLREGQS